MDRAVSFFTSIAIAIPSFWLGLMLVLIFSINLKWLPALGYVGLADDPVEWFRHLLLPALALAAVPVRPSRCRRARHSSTSSSRTTCLPRGPAASRDPWCCSSTRSNGGVPVTTTLGFLLANLLAGAVIIEQVFNLHGLGQLAVTAASGKDIPLLLGVVVMITVSIVIVNLLVDLSYGYFSPRAASELDDARRLTVDGDAFPGAAAPRRPVIGRHPDPRPGDATRAPNASAPSSKKPVAMAAACFLALEIAVTLSRAVDRALQPRRAGPREPSAREQCAALVGHRCLRT